MNSALSIESTLIVTELTLPYVKINKLKPLRSSLQISMRSHDPQFGEKKPGHFNINITKSILSDRKNTELHIIFLYYCSL